jgi:hypothetical protein
LPSRAGDALDEGVDAIAVALGVGDALEHDRRDALAEHDAVGGGVEGVAAAGGRQRVDAGEQQVVVDAVVQVGAAAHDDVAAAGDQLLDREIDRGQGRRAGGVDGVVGAAEIEPVGDAAGDHVGQHAGERVLGQRRQRAIELGRQRADVVRVHRAEAVGARQIGAGLGAEDHRGALAIERAPAGRHRAGVAGVVDRAARDLEAEQLHRLDRLERARRDAVGERIERHRLQEAAPLARGLLAGAGAGRGGVVELRDVPPRRRDLADAVVAADDVGPVGVGVAGAREDRRHADDRDVDGRGVAARSHRAGRVDRQRRGAGRQQRLPVAADLVVQLGDRAGGRAQRGDLADHVHAVGGLGGGVDGDDRVAVAAQALGGDAQAAEVELLERGPPLLRRRAGRGQPRLLGGERRGERRCRRSGWRGRARSRAGVVARTRSRPAGSRAGSRPTPPPRGEQVGGAHQHADLGAARGQRRRQRRHHRARARVVDAAGEQHRHLGHRRVREQPLELRLPQREARARADVAAALAALEDEAARAVLQEQVEQARRRHVQVGRDAGGLERRGLRRATAGDQRHRRLDVVQHRELLVAQLGRHEAEDADAPRPIAQARRGLADQRADLGARRQRQREERQAAGRRHRLGERGAIADPRHRPLRDRVAQAVGRGERRARRERRERGGLLDGGDHRGAHAAHGGADGGEPLREAAGQRRVLTDRDEVVDQRVAAEPRAYRRGVDVAEARRRQIGAGVDAVAGDQRGLAAVHRGDRRAHRRRQRRLTAQRELGVEDDAGRAAGDAGRGGVQADPTLGPHRDGERGDQLLDEHEGGGVADPPAGLAALGDHADRAGGHRGVGLGEVGHLGQHRVAGKPRDAIDGVHDHDGHPRRQLGRGDRAAVRNPDGGAIELVAERGQRRARARRIAAEIEHAQRARRARRRDQPGIRALARGQDQDRRQRVMVADHRLTPGRADATARGGSRSTTSRRQRRASRLTGAVRSRILGVTGG